MCGIAGAAGRFPGDLAARMRDRLRARGPDGDGLFRDPDAPVALAHTRLAIVDLRPEAAQPMTNEDGTVHLVFNGEIYNHVELREWLRARGHRFRSASDTEVIVHLWEEEGEALLARLDGIFAFALWDRRQRRLLLARDPLGVKPLYWATPPEGLLFASELKALLAADALPRSLDATALRQYLSLCWATAPATPLAGVRRLPPGHRVLADGDGRVLAAGAWDDGAPGEAVHRGSLRDHASEVRRLVRSAVDRQRRADVPVAAFLSGGVDSSAVVRALIDSSGGPVTAYTVRMAPGERADENPEDLPYARRLAAEWGVDLREVDIPSITGEAVERMVRTLDEPQPDPACLNVGHVAAAARADGFKVLLSGAGGDDLFAGYRRHRALAWERAWCWVPGPARGAVAAVAGRLPVRRPLLRRVRKYLRPAGLPPAERMARYFLWHEDALVEPLFAERAPGADVLAPIRATLAEPPPGVDPLRRLLHAEVRHFLADHNLNYTDKMAMAHGVEVRVPLLDLALCRYARGIPGRLHAGPFATKRVLREAFRGDLPRWVLDRPKTGFGAPLRRWIREDLRPLVRDVLAPAALGRRGLFDPRAVTALVGANERGEVDASYLVFGLVCIESWCRTFLDRGGE